MKTKPVIALAAPVQITAGQIEGEKQGPAKFTSTFYTGGALEINGYDHPVIVDLAGLENGKVLVANLDHKANQRVGNFDVTNDGKTLVAHGVATAHTPFRDEVVQSASDGYQWQSSLEVVPKQIEEVKAGKSVQVNGQSFAGPAYVTRKGVLKGFAFVSHGADDNTTATIAAIAANSKGKIMKAEIKAWAEGMGIDVENITDDAKAAIEANYAGLNAKPVVKAKSADPFEARKQEASRRRDILAIADTKCADYEKFGSVEQIDEIRTLANHAIEAGMSPQEFRINLYETGIPYAQTVVKAQNRAINSRVLEVALLQAGGLKSIDKQGFTDQEQQLAHDHFKGRIGLNQFFIEAARCNGFQGLTSASHVTPEIQNAAMGIGGPMIRAGGGGFSGIDVSNILAATANKYLHEGWMAVDLTPLRIANVRNVKNFQQITTVSLTGHLQFTKVGNDGEVKHGTLGDLTYNNQADTYATMLAITRKDLINDDMGALTAAPKRLGRGGALKLNDIFWTEFLVLVTDSFFASGNSNINTAVADMTLGGLDATETIFMNQTDPDGKPLGIMPKIILVPTALKNKAYTLMGAMGNALAITSYATGTGDANPFRGRFAVESSPYISNSSYTGSTSTAWWMLADPNECAVIEIAALNGKVEPTVETAAAAPNVLGIQMLGYSDIGVKRQEKRGGVHADGGNS